MTIIYGLFVEWKFRSMCGFFCVRKNSIAPLRLVPHLTLHKWRNPAPRPRLLCRNPTSPTLQTHCKGLQTKFSFFRTSPRCRTRKVRCWAVRPSETSLVSSDVPLSVLNAILLQLQQQSQQLQQQSQQLQQLQQLPQQVQAIANEIHQERARAPIRRYNSRALLCADSIRLFPFVGAAPQAQPRTVEALLALTGPEIDALFIAFGDPVPQGLVAVRRRALAENLGILFDMA